MSENTGGHQHGTSPEEEPPRYGVRVPGWQPPASPQGDAPGAPYAPGIPGAPGQEAPGNAGSGWTTPGAHQGWAAPGSAPGYGAPGAAPGYGPQTGFPQLGGPAGPRPPRPRQVAAASILLWVMAGLYTVFMVGTLVTLASLSSLRALVDSAVAQLGPEFSSSAQALKDAPDSQLRGSLYFLAAIVLVVGVVAVLAGIGTWRGSAGWRIAGTICGGLMALYQILALVTGDFTALIALATCVVVILLWWSKPAGAWFARMGARQQR